jgi:hypothetical protein
VTVADSDAQQYFGNVHTTVRTATGWWLGQDMTGGNFDGMYAGQVGPDDGSIATAVSASWAKPDADGSISNSPDLYNLAWNLRGQYITGFERAVAPSDLATVDTKFGSELDGSDGGLISSRRLIGDIDRGWAVYAGVASLPTRRLIHYNSDGNTQFRQEYVSGKIVDDTQLLLSDRTGPYTAYQSGKQYSERWNYGVYGPAFPVQQANMGSFNRPVKITRTANRIVFWPSLVSDTTGWTADSMNDVESLTVTHNGETVYQGRSITDGFDVPTDVGDYSATVALTRSAPAELSTKVTTTWTFRSGTTKLEQRLPVAAIRFDPDLDDDNTAPAGARFALPVSVEGQSGSGVGSTSALSVEVSYDDGKTWRPAPTIGAGDHRIAFVQHPAGHGFVSLRANASSTSGSTVEETILRAYRF